MTDQNRLDVGRLRTLCGFENVEHHKCLDSTNTHALQKLDAGATTPLLIVADEQTAGRGRSGNSWWSPRGALMFSLVVDRIESNAELPPYSLVVGLAVRDALQALSADVALKVKWPNDVYLEDRKVSGILVEVPPNHRDKLIIGIGVNVNNSVMDAPSELRQRLVSMCDVHGHPFCLTETLAKITTHVASEMASIDTNTLPARWAEHCWLTGKHVGIVQGENTESGTCRGINQQGAILLEQAEELRPVSSGVVEL